MASSHSQVSAIVKDSVAAGAHLVTGGNPHKLGGLFYEPTILTEVTEDMPCFKEEIFGPVVAVRK